MVEREEESAGETARRRIIGKQTEEEAIKGWKENEKELQEQHKQEKEQGESSATTASTDEEGFRNRVTKSVAFETWRGEERKMRAMNKSERKRNMTEEVSSERGGEEQLEEERKRNLGDWSWDDLQETYGERMERRTIEEKENAELQAEWWHEKDESPEEDRGEYGVYR